MTTTVRQLLTSTFRLLGTHQAGETPSNDDMTVALQAFNQMIDSWANDTLMNFSEQPLYLSLQAGKGQYTMGVGGDWAITKPMRIELASISTTTLVNGVYHKDTSTIEWPVTICTEKQWFDVAMKGVQSTLPSAIFDSEAYPLRTVNVWPIPTRDLTIILRMTAGTADYSLDQTLELPPGYERALRFNLAVDLSAEFGKVLDAQVISVANEARLAIGNMNSEAQIMTLDNAILNKPSWSVIMGDTVRRP